MTSSPDQVVLDLFEIFTRMRRTGTNRDDAWYEVLEVAEERRLSEGEVKRLLTLAKGWEKREGYHYHYRSASNKTTTQPPTSASSESVIKPIAPPPSRQQPASQPRSQGLTGELNPDVLRAYEQRKLEQVLDQTEDDAPDQSTVPPFVPATNAPRTDAGTQPMQPVNEELLPDYFGKDSVLLLFFKGYQNPLQIRLQGDQELIIGRATANTAMAPDVDLELVKAGEYGVSRMHAAITRQNNQLLMTDVGSMNGTTLNGQPIHEHEIRVLRDNDEIWFAQLRCKVRFWHPRSK